MVQVLDRKRDFKGPFEIENVIITEEFLEKFPAIEEEHEIVKEKAEKTPIKKGLSKLFKKAKYNAKYLEETIPITKVKRNIHYRNYGIR